MHLNRIMPKKAKKGTSIDKALEMEIHRATIGPFKPGHYKSQKLKSYVALCADESIAQEDVMELRDEAARNKMKKGMTVEAKYMVGVYKGLWYDCVFVEEIEGGWTVAWCDRTKNDTRKTLELIRLKLKRG